MKIITKVKAMQDTAFRLRRKGRRIGFVPTMGYLHAGHVSLLARARRECDAVVMSIYVNPLQFGPQEDLARYPRNLRRDTRVARDVGVDYVFVPGDAQMYPQGFDSVVEVSGLSKQLCGSCRPGHFRGVTTVVAKLFQLVMPDYAYFGQKDAQQAVIIQRMVSDLNMPVRIRVLPIVREPDGLAMSSRNAYLSPKQRVQALGLFESLQWARCQVRAGERSAGRLRAGMKRLLCRGESVTIDYIAIVDARSLEPKATLRGYVLIALAVYVGKVRLIDNVRLRA